MRICTIRGCTGKHWAKGLCIKHYARMLRTGNTLRTIPKRDPVCTVSGCNEKHKAHGLCRKHYESKYNITKKKYYQKNKKRIMKQKKRRYRKKREELLEYGKQWRKDNNEYTKQWRHKNQKRITETHRKYMKQYLQTDRGKAFRKTYVHNRRTLTKGLSAETVQRVYEENIIKYKQLTCYLCFKPIVFGDDCLEHSTPISRGGDNEYDNLGIAHRVCNSKKWTKTLEEWFADKTMKMITR